MMLDLLPLLEQRPRPLRMRLLLLLLLRLLRLVAQARHHGKVLVLRDRREVVTVGLDMLDACKRDHKCSSLDSPSSQNRPRMR